MNAHELGYSLGYLAGMLIVFVAFYLPLILYMIMLTRLLKTCSVQNRAIDPGLVWLLIIPILGGLWHFYVVFRVAQSVSREFQMRNLPLEENNPGLMIGSVLGTFGLLWLIPVIGKWFLLVALILWPVYWIKMAKYKKTLEQHNLYWGINPITGIPVQFPHGSGGFFDNRNNGH